MDKHVGHTRVVLLDCRFDLMRNLMSLADGNTVLNADMKNNIKIETHLAYPAFLNLDDSRHRSRCPANRPDNFTARRRIHDLIQRGAQQTRAICANQRAGKERGPVVGALPWLPADERNRNTDERSNGSDCISAMMPRVGLDSGAFDIPAEPNDISIQNFLHNHSHDEDHKCVRRRSMMRQKDFAHTLNGQAKRSSQDADRDNHCGNRLRFAMTVGVSWIWRTRCNF